VLQAWRVRVCVTMRVRLPTTARLPKRCFCTIRTITDAYSVLGLSAQTATRLEVKRRFYELAKQTHPDVVGARTPAHDESETSTTGSFLQIHTAFEVVMQELDECRWTTVDGVRVRTAPSAAARGGSSESGGARRSAGGKVVKRDRTLAEVLCDRLHEEPSAVRAVWADIVRDELRVTEATLEALFRACGARDGGGGLPTALTILREAKTRGLLDGAMREAALISIIKWCKEDSSSFAKIIAELDESEKPPQVRENLAYANALYSGLSDGYSA
jgi:hypothetical protein